MLSINDKLRLITEGYSIDQINNNQARFSNLITENYGSSNEMIMILESINTDLEFMNETNIAYLQESTLDTLKEKIKRFIAWITEKVMNIIRWIKQKFFRKTTEVSILSANVEKKIKSGQLKETISAIKSGDKERYESIKAKYHSTGGSTGKTVLDITTLRGTVVDADKFDSFVKDNLGKSDTMPVLKVHVKQKIANGTVPDITGISSIIIRTVNTALQNVENFKASLIRGTINGKLSSDDNINGILLSIAIGKKINNIKDLRGYILGDITEVEVSAELGLTASRLLEKFKKDGEEIFTAYNEMKALLDRWKDESISIIAKYNNDEWITPETISGRVQKMNQLITASVSILNSLLSLKSDGLTNCELILKKLDSL